MPKSIIASPEQQTHAANAAKFLQQEFGSIKAAADYVGCGETTLSTLANASRSNFTTRLCDKVIAAAQAYATAKSSGTKNGTRTNSVLDNVKAAVKNLLAAENHLRSAGEAAPPISALGFLTVADKVSHLRTHYLEGLIS